MDQSFMKEKKILPLVLAMSYPMVISMAVNALYNIIDSFYVAQISDQAMTALSLLFPIQNLAHGVAIGFAIGINAVVSYFLGTGETEEANKAATNGLLLNILHGAFLAIICIAVMPWFLGMFTKSETVLTYGIQYTSVVFLFGPLDCASISYEKIFQAVGRMKVSMISLAAGCILNIVLDPLLIFGIGPFPELGIRGAAIATGIGQTLPLIIYLIMYVVRPMNLKIRWRYRIPEPYMMKRLYAIGSAATLNMVLPSLQVTVLNAILSAYSDGYVLVLGVYYKLQTFLYLSANGVVQGIRPLVGYNYGAGEHKRVNQIVKTSMGLVAIIMVVGTVICMAIPSQLIGLFSKDPAIVTTGVTALRIISIGFVASTVSVVFSGALEGLGKGVASLIISLIRYMIFILPVAYFLSAVLGATGVWHAFWITEFFAAVVSYFVYRKVTRS